MQKLSTELRDRVLRFDGVSVIDPVHLARHLLQGVPPSAMRVTHETPEVELFNANVPEADAVAVGTDATTKLSFAWQLPAEFLSLDVTEEVGRALEARRLPPELLDAAIARVGAELEQYETRGMVPFLRAIIYVLHVFRQENVVWGVGRGSSCASYVLYLLGLHCVDCLRYQVPMEEFFHE